MTLQPGTRIGTYEVTAKIGEGGMGEVYRALDTKLRRDVALKVLLADFARDENRLARLEREAHLLASLNHPHVAQIYGLEEEHGRKCLVLELIEGESLQEKLAAGPLSIEESLEIGRQIASALEAAHDKGIIHRDLKPGNVKFTRDGTVKVLDFGIAKAIKGSEGTDSRSDLTGRPTVTAGRTGEGVVMGTAAYMSPEQARGKTLDRRSDIWSLGCVLFECLSGTRPFKGESITDVLGAILHVDPPWEALPPGTPAPVRDLLERALQKDARKRMRDAGDAGVELERALARREWTAHKGAAGVAGSGADAARPGMGMMAGLLAVMLAVGAAAGWWLGRGTTEPPDPGMLESVARLTHDPGLSEWPTWSPDGSQLAFASSSTGNLEIKVRRVDGGQEINVTEDPAEDYQPAFSPDGNRIAFVSTRSSSTGLIKIGATFGMEFRTYGGDVWLVPALGGRARRLAENGNFPVWHPQGTHVAFVGGVEFHRSIMEVPAEGGEPVPILSSEESQWEIVRVQYHPAGEVLSFEDVDGKIYLIPRKGGTPAPLMTGRSHTWDIRHDRIFFMHRDPLGGTRIQVTGFDASRMELAGGSATVALMTGILRDLAVSRDGTRLAVSELEGSLNVTRVELSRSGDRVVGPEEELSPGKVIDRYPAFSPDGKLIAYTSDRLGHMEIWIQDLETGDLERPRLPGRDEGANHTFWSPDGRQITLVRIDSSGGRSLWLVAIDGSGAEELIPSSPGLLGGMFSPDGSEVLYRIQGDPHLEMRALNLETRESRQLVTFDGDIFDGAWSPDGRRIAFISNKEGGLQIWVGAAGGGETRRLTKGNDRIRHLHWSPDGEWIYYQPNHLNIYRISASGGEAQRVTDWPTAGLFIEEPSLSADGRYLVYCKSNGGSSLWSLGLRP